MICKKCGNEFPDRIIVDGTMRVLTSRKYCLDCSPFGSRNTTKLHLTDEVRNETRKCIVCGQEIGTRRKRCGNCNTRIRRIRCKMIAVKYMGGRCVECGYDHNIAALEFHHKDPVEKDFNIGSVAHKAWKTIQQELDKCVMLCSNCHRIKHADREDEILMREVERYSGLLFKKDS